LVQRGKNNTATHSPRTNPTTIFGNTFQRLLQEANKLEKQRRELHEVKVQALEKEKSKTNRLYIEPMEVEKPLPRTSVRARLEKRKIA